MDWLGGVYILKEEKSVYEMVIEIAKKAQEMEDEVRNKELYENEKKEEPIKKINDIRVHRNFSYEALKEYFKEQKDADEE